MSATPRQKQTELCTFARMWKKIASEVAQESGKKLMRGLKQKVRTAGDMGVAAYTALQK